LSTSFIGLDLAWSLRNNSAAVVLQTGQTAVSWSAHRERLGDNADIVAFIRDTAGDGSALVAIDAPLVVPNDEGARPVDRQITHLFGRFGAGCYPAYRKRPGGCSRGPDLVRVLEPLGFVQDPYIQPSAEVRTVFEVYPHPAMLALFGLTQTLKYKARPHRSLLLRIQELDRLRTSLLSLQDPAIHDVPSTVRYTHIEALRGAQRKHYEDLLDAAVCAYTAAYAWFHGPAGYRVYGDTTNGYILTPMTNWLRVLLGERADTASA
jgi:predicted RNase H-like nuclease